MTFFSNSSDPTWNVKINLFDGDLEQKKWISAKIHQSPRIFNETGGAARCQNVKFSSFSNIDVLYTNRREI